MSYANDRAYAVNDRGTTPLIGENSALGAVLRWSRWAVALCALVLLVDLVYVLMIWNDGAQGLARTIASEKALVGLEPDSRAGGFVDATMAVTSEWVFAQSGLRDWMHGQRTGVLAAIVNGFWFVLEAAVLGLQLFTMRIAVLILTLPLFLTMAAVAMADGVYGWLIRRGAGARESGFIYHRAKRAIPGILLLMWTVYLVPPVPMDPRWVLPPFAIALTIALRLRVSFFKKHI